MPGSSYRFSSAWSISAPARAVFAALVNVEDYPSWWRDVRWVQRIDDDSGLVRCRAVLPYALHLHLRRAEEDADTGRLRLDIAGDLEGYVGARVAEQDGRTVVRIVQEVRLHKQQLRRIEPLLRPALRANHAAMMWRGQRGLRAHLNRARTG